jgi:hypothetical protein
MAADETKKEQDEECKAAGKASLSTASRASRSRASRTSRACANPWNSTEQCWDCPCHGSHFGPDGTVLNGPASEPLAGEGAEEPRERSQQRG